MTDIWDERRKGLEEDYFHRKDRELWEQMRQRPATEERERRQEEATFWHCLKCGEELEEILFRGVTIDRCPGCSGMWLDSGEVERLTVRSSRGWLSHFWRSVGR
jgi:hypothetical protein